jgi:diacylglycerol kinase family enzyme
MTGVSRHGSIVVIVNTAAGTARGRPRLAAELGELFRRAGCAAEIVVLRDGQNPVAAGRDASARASIVVAGGGDGTVSAVAAGVVGSPAALGILPLGTFNHFAKDLGIPLDLRQAVAVVAARQLQRVDVGQVNDRVFVNNSSIGIYPDIVAEREELRRRGHRKWPAMAFAMLRVLRRYRGVTVLIEVGGRQRMWRTPLVVAANNEYALEGRRLGARERLDRGRLFVYLAPRARVRDLPLLLALALAGRARRSGAFEIVSATELTIGTSPAKRVRVAVDGEVTTMGTPLRYRTCPGALAVVVPRR